MVGLADLRITWPEVPVDRALRVLVQPVAQQQALSEF
jgi:hypothetical protein